MFGAWMKRTIAIVDGVMFWYDEGPDWIGEGRPVVGAAQAMVGHYTQLTWTNSNKLGCTVCDGNGGTVLSCNYYVKKMIKKNFERFFIFAFFFQIKNYCLLPKHTETHTHTHTHTQTVLFVGVFLLFCV